MAHQGISKVEPLVIHRYWWGPQEFMRNDIRKYISLCRPCCIAEVPRHKAGAASTLTIGDYPFHTLAVDVFKTGVKHEGYDSVVSFADYFSRYIVACATQGDPDHTEIARLLFVEIVRHFGVLPRAPSPTSGRSRYMVSQVWAGHS